MQPYMVMQLLHAKELVVSENSGFESKMVGTGNSKPKIDDSNITWFPKLFETRLFKK